MDLFGIDDRLPVTASDCVRIGMAGNCGVGCPVFLRGECDEAQEITKQEIIDEYGKEESIAIFKLYDCFKLIIQK